MARLDEVYDWIRTIGDPMLLAQFVCAERRIAIMRRALSASPLLKL